MDQQKNRKKNKKKIDFGSTTFKRKLIHHTDTQNVFADCRIAVVCSIRVFVYQMKENWEWYNTIVDAYILTEE